MKRTNLIIWGIRALLTLTCAGAVVRGILMYYVNQEFTGTYFMTALTALVTIILTLIPDFISHKDIMVMPATLQAGFTVFTFLAMFFGEILRFYDRFFWWDSMLHFSSGIMFSIIGYMLFISLNREQGVRSRLNPLSVIIFSVCFSIACGTVWEIFEFIGDSLLGMNMQRWANAYTPEEWAALQNVSNLSNPGLIDTMKDIINDATGTLLSVIVILPLAKKNSSYVKANIPPEELIAEGRETIEEIWAKRRNSNAEVPGNSRPGESKSVNNRG